ncbi:MAG: glycosyltransferase [Pseudodesulfovibrio sp.]
MKILFLIRSLDPGGAERQLVNLANGLGRKGHDVQVAVFYAGGELERLLDGVQLIDLGKKGRWDLVRFFFPLIGLLRTVMPDIVHGYLGTSNVLCVFLKLFYGRARIVWGVRASNMDLGQYDRAARLSYALECKLSRFADMIIVNSESGMRYAAVNGFPEDRMVVVPNGVDTVEFAPDSVKGEWLRKEWGIRKGEQLVGLVARLDPMKGHEDFIKSAALALKENSSLRFVLVGGGNEKTFQALKNLANNLGIADKMVWAGVRKDMPAVHNAIDICCSSSLFGEGFSNSIAEAMACGNPCVVTDVGDSAIIVGKAGSVVCPGDTVSLSEAILERASSSPESKDIRLRIVEKFSVEMMVEKTEVILFKLLK